MFGSESEVMDAVNLRVDQDKRLIQAILRKDIKQVDRLLGQERINPDGHPLSLKGPPLHLAVQLGTTTIVDTLVKFGANINNTHGPFCTTGFRAVLSPLHLAVKAKNSWMIRKLSSLGADADITDSKGTSARQIASQNAHLATVLAEGERAFRAKISRHSHSNKSSSSTRLDIDKNLRPDQSASNCINLSRKQQIKQDNLRKKSSAKLHPQIFHRSTPSTNDSEQHNNFMQYQYRENAKNLCTSKVTCDNQSELIGRLRQEHSRRNTIFREINKISQFVENQMSVIDAEKEAHLASINRTNKIQEQHDRALEEQSALLNQIHLQKNTFEKDSSINKQLQNITPSSSYQKTADKDISTTLSSPFQQTDQQTEQESKQQFEKNHHFLLKTKERIFINKSASNDESTSLNRPSYSTPVTATYNNNDAAESKYDELSLVNSTKQSSFQIQNQNKKNGQNQVRSEKSEDEGRAVSESTGALASELTLSPSVSTDLRHIAQSKSGRKKLSGQRPQIPKLDLTQLGLGKSSRQIFKQGFAPFDDLPSSYIDSTLYHI